MKGKSEVRITSEATAYATKIQERIADMDFSPPGEAHVMKLAYLENVHTRLLTGELTKQDAMERIEAGADHFARSPPQPIDDTPPLLEFPLGSLVGDYPDYAKAVARGTLTDSTTAGAATLGGVSAIVGTRIRVRIHQSWCYHSGLYVTILAPPSYGKSGVIESADQPVRTYEAELRDSLAKDVQSARADALYVEESIKAKKVLLASALKKGEAADDMPKEIAQLQEDLEAIQAKASEPLLIQDDFTIETTGELLKLNGERMTVTSGDTDMFNVSRYSDNPAIGLLLKAWKGEPHREHRRGRPDVDLLRPAMAMLVASQTKNVQELARKNAALVYRGFLPRFLPVLPESTIGFRDKRKAMLGDGISRVTQARFNEELLKLARHLNGLEGGVIELAFTPEALERFCDYSQGFENRMAPEGSLRPILECAGKYDIQLQKLCGINWAMGATADGDYTPTIVPETVDRAAQQLEFFSRHQHRLYERLGQGPVESIAEKLRERCNRRQGETVSFRDLRQSIARDEKREIVMAAVEMLQAEGLLKVTVEKTGGRDSTKVHVL